MKDWIKVVTEPLGLAGFALFLVFGLLARVKRADERRWLSPVAAAMAFVVLLGGLGLALVQFQHKSAAQTPTPLPAQNINASTSGDGSPILQGVSGPVTLTIDQSGSPKSDKPPAKKTP